MSSTTDRILDVIDAGLQSSDEHGYGTDHLPGLCARCQYHEPGVGDLCTGCRAFLLGDSDDDPAHRRPTPTPSAPPIACEGFTVAEHATHYTCWRARGRTLESHLHPRGQTWWASEDEPSLTLRFDYSAS